jgi:hypothetical protein
MGTWCRGEGWSRSSERATNMSSVFFHLLSHLSLGIYICMESNHSVDFFHFYLCY